jgi:hypothetical protein
LRTSVNTCKYWEQMARDLRPVHTAPTEQAAVARFEEFTAPWGAQFPAIIALWRPAWSEFLPFLDYDVEIRRVICSTDEIVHPSVGRGVLDILGGVGSGEQKRPAHQQMDREVHQS